MVSPSHERRVGVEEHEHVAGGELGAAVAGDGVAGVVERPRPGGRLAADDAAEDEALGERVPAEAVRAVDAARALAAEFRPGVRAHLTKRQREILDLIAQGLSNKEIARELNIERATVKNHVHSILEKLQVQTRGAAVAQVRLWDGPLRSTPIAVTSGEGSSSAA